MKSAYEGIIPVDELATKVKEMHRYIASLETYRAGLVEEQRRADLWEQEIGGIVEALAALQYQLNGGMTWDDKQAVVKTLVKGDQGRDLYG